MYGILSFLFLATQERQPNGGRSNCGEGNTFLWGYHSRGIVPLMKEVQQELGGCYSTKIIENHKSFIVALVIMSSVH